MRIAGRTQGLPPPQALYPTTLATSPFAAPTNQIKLTAGQGLVIPAGMWIISGGAVSAVQYSDPVRKEWIVLTEPGAPWVTTVLADGFNYRIINLSGIATGATVTAAGSDYVEETTMVNPFAGSASRWTPIIGGAVGGVSITFPGAAYSIPPIVIFGRPPAPGIPAAGEAILGAGGVVTGITVTDPGAGYATPPQIIMIPSSTDPNFILGRIKDATAASSLTGEGTLTAVLLINFGPPQPAPPTLTIAGQGTGATATADPAAWLAPADDLVTIQPAGVL